MLLENKVVLVTGAGRGMGQNVARRLAQEGAQVAIHYHRSRDAAEALAAEVGGTAFGADLTDPAQAQGLVQQTVQRFGRLDALVCNAASFAHGLTIDTATWADFQNEWNGVVGVVVNPVQAALPYLKAASVKAAGGGRIVLLMATLSTGLDAGHIVHTTAKAALVGLSRTLVRDLGPHGITVNTVSPGMTLTEYSQGLPDDVKARVARSTPLRRLATGDDIAGAVLFFLSPLADFVTGANLAPDGGLAIT